MTQPAHIVEAMSEAVQPIVERAHLHGHPVKLNGDFIDELLVAALSVALEECAKTAEGLVTKPLSGEKESDPFWLGFNNGCTQSASAIRNLGESGGG